MAKGITLAEYRALRAKKAQAEPGKAQVRLPKLSAGPNAVESRLRDHLSPSYGRAQWLYEQITLRLPAGTLYTPDWTVWEKDQLLALIEVKGPHIHRGASLEKFKAARAAFPHFDFQFWQWKNDQWHTAH
jgi:hypothetical protein